MQPGFRAGMALRECPVAKGSKRVEFRKGDIMRGYIRNHDGLRTAELWAAVVVGCIICFVAAAAEDEQADVERRLQKRISVDFKNTAIDDVIRIMAKQAYLAASEDAGDAHLRAQADTAGAGSHGVEGRPAVDVHAHDARQPVWMLLL